MKKRKILAIQNCEVEGFGLYEKYFIDNSITCEVARPYRGGNLPEPDEFDGILIGGTPISANDVAEHTFLEKEREYLRRALENGKPCFGICCGAQILAGLLGASVTRCEKMEIGGYKVTLTEAGKSDGLMRGFPAEFPVFHWHGDMFAVPKGAELLVAGAGCRNQMFRQGNVVGVLFHLEVTSAMAADFADCYVDELDEFGKTGKQVVEECRTREGTMAPLASTLMRNFVDLFV